MLIVLRPACSVWRSLRFGYPLGANVAQGLSMRIQGTVNADVNGGATLLRQLFLESSLRDEEQNVPFIQELKNSIIDQFKIVDFAIKLFKQVMKPQDRLLVDDWEIKVRDQLAAAEPTLGQFDMSAPPSFTVLPSLTFLKDLKPRTEVV